MLLSWLEDDVMSEQSDHSGFANAAAIAACLAAALLLHFHAAARHPAPDATAHAPHVLTFHHPVPLRGA